MSPLRTAIERAQTAAQNWMTSNASQFHWYPCGFAWVEYKCRKNAAIANDLVAMGFKWDDYRKVYALSMGTFVVAPEYGQCMDLKIAGGREFVRSMEADGFPGYFVREWMD